MFRTLSLIVLSLSCLASDLLAQSPQLPPTHTGLYYVSGSASNNVGEYAPDGTLLRTFSAAGLVGPRGVAVDDHGNLVVVCAGSDRIMIFDLTGAVVQEVVHVELTTGTGIARSADGRWYVANFNPGRVLVFDADWNHLESITQTGMSGVNCVSFDPDGSFTVSDASHAQLHRFDGSHQFLQTISHGTLASPMSIAMDSMGSHYVSNGGGAISKFDASWNFLMSFGAGIVSLPQGIAIDEHDVLTVTNYSGGTINRFNTDGVELESYPLAGVATGRNLCWQTSFYALARLGSVDAAQGLPVRVLTANGQTGDALGRMTLATTDALLIEMSAPPSGPTPAALVLYARSGEPTPFEAVDLPRSYGLFAFAPVFAGGSGMTLINSIGLESRLGTGRFPAVSAPGVLLSFPSGVGRTMTLTLQALVRDAGSAGAGYSASNALVIHIQ